MNETFDVLAIHRYTFPRIPHVPGATLILMSYGIEPTPWWMGHPLNFPEQRVDRLLA